MNESVIELRELTKKYGEQTAVDRLNLNIYKGEIFGLLGPNGAGKSTTILMMLGLTEPTSGSVRVLGIDSIKFPIQVKRRVGYLPDDVGFYEDRTGYENLMFTARLNRLTEQEADKRVKSLLERVRLSDAADKKAGAYSRGMRQRLGLADVLIKKPEIIILDEPTLGIDPEGVRELLDLIVALSREEQITVLISSHHLHQMQQICDRVGLFVKGKLLAEGPIHTLAEQLFAKDAVTIEAGISPLSDEIVEKIKNIDGVARVSEKDGMLHIGCTKDVSATVARVIVENGAALTRLNPVQYGLDEIYHRYFEGGDVREGKNG